jgi:hypothetical protein
MLDHEKAWGSAAAHSGYVMDGHFHRRVSARKGCYQSPTKTPTLRRKERSRRMGHPAIG